MAPAPAGGGLAPATPSSSAPANNSGSTTAPPASGSTGS
ncbi:hypothetical protein CAter282_0250 [Collimonas arenae]|uniref:Uncharacterized protein n=2 Tax=Collimonas arenae TaxID=279058 RepID=A0A127PL88_9BURK|nr:hypothetical protein CAter10_0264 [Collimonas arenae]AMP08072.1 hypothetical protein CAter282_0250 [Collimonas arenae]